MASPPIDEHRFQLCAHFREVCATANGVLFGCGIGYVPCNALGTSAPHGSLSHDD